MKHILASAIFATSLFAAIGTQAEAATTVLLNQDFESPTNFRTGFDVDSDPVNSHYGNQPPGFTFGNSFTVETVNVTDSANPSDGQRSFSQIGGYTGDLATSGDYVIGMLSSAQDDRLGLTFDVTGFDFLNVQIDVTSMDLDCCGGPFVGTGGVGFAPTFRFSLFEDVGFGGIGGGALLDFFDLVAGESDRHVLDFTRGTFGLDASGTTDGIVTLQIDLLTGGYAAFDNLIIASSDTEGDVGAAVPLPAAGWLLLGGLFAMRGVARRRGRLA